MTSKNDEFQSPVAETRPERFRWARRYFLKTHPDKGTEDVLKGAHVSRSTLYRAEHKQPKRLNAKARLARYYGIDYLWAMFNIGTPWIKNRNRKEFVISDDEFINAYYSLSPVLQKFAKDIVMKLSGESPDKDELSHYCPIYCERRKECFGEEVD